MQRPVSGMHIALGLMHTRSQDFGLLGAKLQITCYDVMKNSRKEGLFMGQRMKDQKLGSGLARNQDFVEGERLETQLKQFYSLVYQNW